MKTFLSHLAGSEEVITEQAFGQSDLEAMRRAVKRQADAGKTSGVIGYGDFGEGPGDFSSFGPGASASDMLDSFTDPKFRLETTIGMATWKTDENGDIIVEDEYDFNATREQVDKALEDSSLGAELLRAFREAGISGVLNVIANTFGATEDEKGQKVRINLGKIGQGDG